MADLTSAAQDCFSPCVFQYTDFLSSIGLENTAHLVNITQKKVLSQGELVQASGSSLGFDTATLSITERQLMHLVGQIVPFLIIVSCGSLSQSFDASLCKSCQNDPRQCVLVPGHVIGLKSIFTGEVAHYSLKAAEDQTTILSIDAKRFVQLSLDHSSLHNAILNFMASQVCQELTWFKKIHDLKENSGGQKPRIAFFSITPDIQHHFELANQAMNQYFDMVWIEDVVNETTVFYASQCQTVCGFVNDLFNREVLETLASLNVKHLALRCAGFDLVDLEMAKKLNISVTHVPAYSPQSIAEFTIGLLLACSRKIVLANDRCRLFNFSDQHLAGFNLDGRKVGVLGTGRIGELVIKILNGIGCDILCYDLYRNENVEKLYGAHYVDSLDDLWQECDVLCLFLPLTPSTKHVINRDVLSKCKDGIVIVNTARGLLIDTEALIEGLKSKKVSAAALDVYEHEQAFFFKDCSNQIIPDDLLTQLLAYPNVILTPHIAYMSNDALEIISKSVLDSAIEIKEGKVGSALTNAIRSSYI